jgi:hypothetical protein
MAELGRNQQQRGQGEEQCVNITLPAPQHQPLRGDSQPDLSDRSSACSRHTAGNAIAEKTATPGTAATAPTPRWRPSLSHHGSSERNE